TPVVPFDWGDIVPRAESSPADEAAKAVQNATATTNRCMAAPSGPLVLHPPQDLVFAAFADEPVVLARLVERQVREVPDEQQHEHDRDVVGDRHDRPEVCQRAHDPPCTGEGPDGQPATVCRNRLTLPPLHANGSGATS